MQLPHLSVREIATIDIDLITNYWLDSDKQFLIGMGVDLSKVPERDQMKNMLAEQINQSYEDKKSYCIIWELDQKAVGHCNVNKIIFGEEAFMHLHMWEPGIRKKGFGAAFVKLSIPYFFKNLKLKKLYCEPYALNSSPNKTLPKIGFEFVKKYITTPGWINFEQPVNLWELTYEKFINFQ